MWKQTRKMYIGWRLAALLLEVTWTKRLPPTFTAQLHAPMANPDACAVITLSWVDTVINQKPKEWHAMC